MLSDKATVTSLGRDFLDILAMVICPVWACPNRPAFRRRRPDTYWPLRVAELRHDLPCERRSATNEQAARGRARGDQQAPPPTPRSPLPQYVVDQVVAAIIGARAFALAPSAGPPRIEDCTDEHRQEQRTCTKQQREHGLHQFSPEGALRQMARRRPKRSEALHTTHRSGAASPPQRRYFPTLGSIPGGGLACAAQASAAYHDDRWPKQAISGCLPRCAGAIHAQVWHGSGPATGCGFARVRRYRPKLGGVDRTERLSPR
jgi:hypothetical protein